MDPLNNEMSELEKIKRLRRVRERNERIEQQKVDNHWIFVAGTLVAKYLKDDLDIPVHKGKDATAKNAVAFAPLENILAYLASHKDFTAQLMAMQHESPDTF